MTAEIVDCGNAASVCAAQKKVPAEAQPCAGLKLLSPVFNFFEHKILEVDGKQPASCLRQGLQSLRVLGGTVPGLFRDDVQTGFERRLNHPRHMRARSDAEPGDLCAARFHGFREAADV